MSGTFYSPDQWADHTASGVVGSDDISLESTLFLINFLITKYYNCDMVKIIVKGT